MTRRTRTLAQIVKVRDVQESAARLAVARANGDLQRLADEKAETVERLDAREAAWQAAVAGPRLDPGVNAAWSAAVVEGGEQLRDVDRRIAETEARKDDLSRGWRTALTKSDVARDLAGKAKRRAERAREEAALADLADRIAGRGRQS